MRQHAMCMASTLVVILVAGCGGDPGAMSEEHLAKMTVADFSLKSLDGETLTLSELHVRKPVLLDFSGTWCPPCTRAVPGVKRLHEAYGDSIAIIAIYDNRSAASIRNYVEEHEIEYPVALDMDGSVARDYKVRGVPTFVVIGRDGSAKYYGHNVSAAGAIIEKELTR